MEQFEQDGLVDGLTPEEQKIMQTPLSEVPKEHMHVVISVNDKRVKAISEENERYKKQRDAEEKAKREAEGRIY